MCKTITVPDFTLKVCGKKIKRVLFCSKVAATNNLRANVAHNLGGGTPELKGWGFELNS